MEIKKKCWPELFEKILKGEKKADIRLADFDLKLGDILVLEEYNPKTKQYTGRTLKKEVKNINKINLNEFWTSEQIKEKGVWLIELE
jgi:ribosomal protein S17